MKVRRSSIQAPRDMSVVIAQTVVAVAMLSGFFNLVPAPLSLATMLIDAIVLAMIVLVIAPILRTSVELWMVIGLMVLVIAICLAVFGQEPLGMALNAVRYLMFYSAIAVFIAVRVTSREGALRILETVMRLGLFIATFGCLQFAFRSVLPQWLLFSSDTRLFGYFGTDITRSTGLVGNSIVYGTLTTLVFALWLARCVQPVMRPRRRLFYSGAVIVTGCGVVVSFSRVSIVAAATIVLCACAVVLVRLGARKAVPLAVGATLLVTIVVLCVGIDRGLQRQVAVSFIVQGLFLNNNASVSGSNDGHELFTRLALQSFAEHPWTGIGLGSQTGQSDRVIITDGFHLALLVEGGLLLMVPMVLFIIAIAARLVLATREVQGSDVWAPLAVLLFFLTQVLGAGFYNTGFYGKVPNVVFWVVLGAVVALSRSSRCAAGTFPRTDSLSKPHGRGNGANVGGRVGAR